MRAEDKYYTITGNAEGVYWCRHVSFEEAKQVVIDFGAPRVHRMTADQIWSVYYEIQSL